MPARDTRGFSVGRLIYVSCDRLQETFLHLTTAERSDQPREPQISLNTSVIISGSPTCHASIFKHRFILQCPNFSPRIHAFRGSSDLEISVSLDALLVHLPRVTSNVNTRHISRGPSFRADGKPANKGWTADDGGRC